mgnify:CR=1 FL=1
MQGRLRNATQAGEDRVGEHTQAHRPHATDSVAQPTEQNTSGCGTDEKDRKDDKKDDMGAATPAQPGMKKGGMVKSSASKRADGCAQRGKTKGRMV